MTTISPTSAAAAMPQASLPLTSLIIASRNRPKLLAETVESILKGDQTPTEIIIVDQSHQPHPTLSDLTTERVCNIRYQWSHSVGSSQARNEGIATARYELLAMTDDDMIVAPDWFATLIRALIEAGPKAVVTGQVLPSETEVAGGFAPSIKEDQKPAAFAGRLWADVLYTGNMALPRRAIEEVGNFDERLGAGARFPAAGDNDLGFRLLEAGYSIRYAPEAIVYHRAWRAANDYIPLRWAYGYGQGAYYAKHMGWHDLYMLHRLQADISRYGSRFVRYGLRRSRRQNFGDAVYILGLLCGAAKWLLTQPKTR